MRQIIALGILLAMGSSCCEGLAGERLAEPVEQAIARAGGNAAEIRGALAKVPAGQRAGMEFLVANMPDRDLKSLTADFLLENVDLAFRARAEAPWGKQLSDELFLNDVLPYASVTEERDDWRRDLRERCLKIVKGAKSPGEAAALLNNRLFPAVGVRYNLKRRSADQGPAESIKSGMATCTGLSILLIDACRAVGVPARFVGTRMWTDGSGNHSWVEIWDEGWHFMGAAEPDGMKLDAAWFVARASLARRDEPQHAIYAVSFKRTPIRFPCEWSEGADYVSAVNVTDRYTAGRQALAQGMGRAMFRVVNGDGGDRVATTLRVESESGKLMFAGPTKDDRYDTNDHTTVVMPIGQTYSVTIDVPSGTRKTTIQFHRSDELFTFDLAALTATAARSPAKRGPIESLREYLAVEYASRPPLDKLPFSQAALSRSEVEQARGLLWNDHVEQIRSTCAEEMKEHRLRAGELVMPFVYKTFGDKPATGRSLFISLHGGGEAPKDVNDHQWVNQQTLYEPSEGIYVAPRAPTDKWNMWHQAHIDGMFRRLIEDMVVFEDVNPNRVYLMGYSAGGDGVYQLAPRMADSWAAAAMMAGHPNDASPLGLRNIGFAIYVGGLDAAFQRNEVAREWKAKLAELHRLDPQGYQHLVEIPPDKGHWMDHLDAAAVPWMERFVRNPVPQRVVWKQDDVPRPNFYWLAVDVDKMKVGSELVATRNGQEIDVDAKGVDKVTLRFDDRMIDFDKPVVITGGKRTVFDDRTSRRISSLAKTLRERGDPDYMFSAEVTVSLAAATAKLGN